MSPPDFQGAGEEVLFLEVDLEGDLSKSFRVFFALIKCLRSGVHGLVPVSEVAELKGELLSALGCCTGESTWPGSDCSLTAHAIKGFQRICLHCRLHCDCCSRID